MSNSIKPLKRLCKATLNMFFNKNILNVALQYLFNVLMQFNLVFNLKLIKVDQKVRIFKNLEEICKIL